MCCSWSYYCLNLKCHQHIALNIMPQLEVCHIRLFANAGKDPGVDEVPDPSLEWKKACAEFILPQVCYYATTPLKS